LTIQSPLQIVEHIASLTEEERLKTVCTLWLWWTEWNKANHSEYRLTTVDLLFQLARHTSEWKEFFSPKPKPVTEQVQQVQVWQPPPAEFVMINIDGSYSEENGPGGWGCVARDHEGEVIFAAAGPAMHLSNAMHAEVMALMRAIEFAEQFGMGRVIFATDCASLQHAATTTELDRAPLGTLFREVKYLLSMGFIEHQIIFCPRLCNKPAHLLASYGVREIHGSHSMWLTDLPDDVARAVAGDLAASTS
jgi:hypothetical protein